MKLNNNKHMKGNLTYYGNSRFLFNNEEVDQDKEKNRKSSSIVNYKNNIPFDLTNITKTSANVLSTDEKFNNIHIIVNNNFIKSINDTHTQSNFRNELLKMDNQMHKMNTAHKKNKSFHNQPKNNLSQNMNMNLTRDNRRLIPSENQKKIKPNVGSVYSELNKSLKMMKNNFKPQPQSQHNVLPKSNISSSNSNSTANSSRKLNNMCSSNPKTSGNSKVNSCIQSREASVSNLHNTKNKNSRMPPGGGGLATNKEEKNLTNNQKVSPFIQSSYSELAKKLKNNKSNTGRTSFQNSNHMYFNSIYKQKNKSQEYDNSQLKIKSFDEKYNKDPSYISEVSVNMDQTSNVVRQKNSIKNNMPILKRNSDFINIEGPEELHYMYVNLNQQQKRVVSKLESNEAKEVVIIEK